MSTVKKLYGRHHGLVDPFTVAVPKHISMLWPLLKRSKAFKYKGCNFTDLFHRYIDRARVPLQAGEAYYMYFRTPV